MEIKFPELPENLNQLEQEISEREKIFNLKPDAHARIVWADRRNKVKTSYSVVYLHGFTASQGEGYPVHLDFARRYGLNLFLSRLKGHGIKSRDAFAGLTPQQLIDSAAEAIAVGRRLGDKIILMGTSTGASLALYMGSKIEANLHGLILYSPLIDFYGIKSIVLANKIGRLLLRIIPGNKYMVKSRIGHTDENNIWYSHYRLEGALALGKLIEQTMTPETFKKISLPVFAGYYYRNKNYQDKVVSVSAILKMYDTLSTDFDDKEIADFPMADTHVICSPLLSKSVNDVKSRTYRFSENVLGLKPLRNIQA